MTSRISSELASAIQAYQQQKTQSRQKSVDSAASAGIPADKVDLSPLAIELARDLALATKIVRESGVSATSSSMSPQERIQERKAQIDELAARIMQGSYRPPLQEIAARLAPALHVLDEEV